MKIVIAGGSGQIGKLLQSQLADWAQFVVLTRSPKQANEVAWDGATLGEWCSVLEGADVLLNLSGKSVNCRPTQKNREALYRSRIDSTRVLGAALERCAAPPALWLQASAATLYPHSFSEDATESSPIGGGEEEIPPAWEWTVQLLQDWEGAQREFAGLPIRQVQLRTSLVLWPDPEGSYQVFTQLAKWGAGGRVGSGRQYVSWIVGSDFARALRFIIESEELEGPINMTAPEPLPQAEFMRELRRSLGSSFAPPATSWMARIGAFLIGTDSELILKSRRVVPEALKNAGFQFEYPKWKAAAAFLATTAQRLD